PLQVNKATPSITTSLSSASILNTGSVTDTATLSGSSAGATGAITISVYSGSDASACVVGNLVQSKTATPATNGDGGYTATFSGLAAGNYEAQAVFARDANALPTPRSSDRPLQLNQAPPSITTSLSSASILNSGSV